MPTALHPWQPKCERALKDFTSDDALRFWGWGHGPSGRQEPPFDYRFEHTLAVVKLGRWLAPLVGADEEVLLCAAWLHDCRKRLGASKQGASDSHASDAADAVEGILQGTDFPPHKIPLVRHAILRHVGLTLDEPLEPLETACLWDIDKLSKLGAASLVHFIGVNSAFQPLTTAGVLESGEKWLDLARKIAASMNTAPARSEAESRVEFLARFYGRLRNEWN
jgi:uncharacterized protein